MNMHDAKVIGLDSSMQAAANFTHGFVCDILTSMDLPHAQPFTSQARRARPRYFWDSLLIATTPYIRMDGRRDVDLNGDRHPPGGTAEWERVRPGAIYRSPR
jgi:hypothetical protein